MGHTGKRCCLCNRQIKQGEPYTRYVTDQKLPTEYIHLECSGKGRENKMDECCIEFCKGIDALIKDEEEATQGYKIWADKAKGKQEFVKTIFNSLSTDEHKHSIMLKDVKALVCSQKNLELRF